MSSKTPTARETPYFAYTKHSGDGAPRRLLISDNDGNTITLFQDPTRPLG